MTTGLEKRLILLAFGVKQYDQRDQIEGIEKLNSMIKMINDITKESKDVGEPKSVKCLVINILRDLYFLFW